jgi:hypothetical protein
MTPDTCVTRKTCVGAIILVGALMTASSAQAQVQVYTEIINGAACTSYPQASPANGQPYQHIFYAFRDTVFCQLRMATPWQVRHLRYVFFEADASAGTGTGALTARLCVHEGTYSITCGPATTVTPGTSAFRWVTPPSQLPTYVLGAYVHFSIPSSRTWIIRYLMPYFQN